MFHPQRSTTLAGLVTAVTASCLAAPALAAPAPSPDLGSAFAKTISYTGELGSGTGASLGQGSCDVNGDGLSDTVTGSVYWDHAPHENTGAAYVILGGSDMTGGALDDPASVGAVRIDGSEKDDMLAGYDVNCAGDVNGDGLDDVVMAQPFSGEAYVVFGDRDFTPVKVDYLGDRGYRIKGPSVLTSNVVQNVGDVNGDGLDDLAVLEQQGSYAGRVQNGRIWIVAGQDDVADIDLTHPGEGQVLATLDGDGQGNRLFTVATVGDVDGDKVADIAVGAYQGNGWGKDGGAASGMTYVVSGKRLKGSLDLAKPDDYAFAVRGPQRGRDRLGHSITGLGDINGDGIADMAIGVGSPSYGESDPRSGAVAIVYGSSSKDTVITDPASSGHTVHPVSDATTKRGYWIDGANPGDSFGYSVAAVPDITGDGKAELLVGAYGYQAKPELRNSGAAYLIAGRTDVERMDVSTAKPAEAVRIDGQDFRGRFGQDVASVGDVNHDGVPDIAISGDAINGDQRGRTTIIQLRRIATPPPPKPVVNLTIHTAGTKKIGATTYAWGTLTGTTNPTKVCTQTLTKPGTWSTSQCTTTKKDGTYTIPLTYHHNTPGTTTWRTIAPATNTTSTTATLTRTR